MLVNKVSKSTLLCHCRKLNAWLNLINQPKLHLKKNTTFSLQKRLNNRTVKQFKALVGISSSVISLVFYWKNGYFKECSIPGLITVAQCSSFTEESVDLVVKYSEKKEISGIFENVRLILRAAHLTLIFFPLLLFYPLTILHSSIYEHVWLKWLLWSVERAGATAIKFGQWASTRRDLFSPVFCEYFSRLTHDVRPHSWQDTASTLRKEYGPHWQQMFGLRDFQEPVGSGCIAQVYKGRISTIYSRKIGETIASDVENLDQIADKTEFMNDKLFVAIKVLHPGICEMFRRDLKLMRFSAHLLTRIFPRLHWVSLTQCVEEFAVTLNNQLNMKYECENLQRFAKNFEGIKSIKVPKPMPLFCRSNVLVETFEEGVSMVDILADKTQSESKKKKLATIGVDLLMKMVFVDNFVHADLHPGNILVQAEEQTEDSALVLLDCGITTSLSPDDREKFRQVFTAVVKGDGDAVAVLFLQKSAVNQCSDPQLFREEMARVVMKGREKLTNLSEIKVSELMHEVFDVLSRHKIQMEASFSTVILAMAMLEGLGRSLDPQLNLLQRAKPTLLGWSLGL